MNLRHESDILPRCLQHVVQRAPTEALNFGRLCVLAGFMAPQENKSVAGSLSSRPLVKKSGGNGLIPQLFPLRGVLRTASCVLDRAKAILSMVYSEPKKFHDLYPKRTRINFQSQKEDKKHLRSLVHPHAI